jgi:hypothetical protein
MRSRISIASLQFHRTFFNLIQSGPPAWKQLPTRYQISEGDHLIPLDFQRTSDQQVNATTLNPNASHAAYVSRPNQIADFILNATKGK